MGSGQKWTMHCVSLSVIILSFVSFIHGLPVAGKDVAPVNEVADLKKQLDNLHSLLTALSVKLDAADGGNQVTVTTTPSPSQVDLDIIGHMISRLHHLENEDKLASPVKKVVPKTTPGADSSHIPPGLITKLSKNDLMRLQKALKWKATQKSDSSMNSVSAKRGVQRSVEQSALAVPQLSLDEMRQLAQEQYEGHFGEFGVKRRLGQLTGTWQDGPVDDSKLGAVLLSDVDTTENPKAMLAKLINTLQNKTDEEVEDDDSRELSTLSQAE